MGCLKKAYNNPEEEQKYFSALHIVHSGNNVQHQEQAAQKITYHFVSTRPENEGYILGVYCYALNNPLRYTDPDGNIVVAAAIYYLFFTDMGYQTQKYVSPYAFKVDWHLGVEKIGLGYEYSHGMPKLLSFGQNSVRFSHGETYFSKTNTGYTGWETRNGHEQSTWLGMYSNDVTSYSFDAGSERFNQTVGVKSYGIRGSLSLELSNDMDADGYNGDGGDRYKTAAGKLSIGKFSIGLNLFTGDPGLAREDRKVDPWEGPNGTYEKGPYGDPDEYRNGILYGSLFGVKVGWDSEWIRDKVQNRWVHDSQDIPRFAVDKTKKGSFYFQLGSSGVW